MKKIVLYIFITFCSYFSTAQNCTTLGQTPLTAFPVCGTDTFSQSDVPACGGTQIVTPGCSDFLSDINPFWYRFTCFTAGTLGFIIQPNNAADDYDWQIFDITNKNANDVFTDPTMFVACNWSGEAGTTGAGTQGSNLTVCGSSTGGPFRPLFSSMPTLIVGHEYILLISHFDGSTQSGYKLSFGGGTANITDPIEPKLNKARAICDGIKMSIKLNKKMKCNSLAANGSDFILTPPLATIIAAEGVNCNNGFDMDSIVVTLGNPIPPGNYTLTINIGTDGNNLLDNCGRSIPTGQNLPVTVFPLTPTPLDSIQPLTCANNDLVLVFSKPMFCNSIAADGSDFIITNGPVPLLVRAAKGECDSAGFATKIHVQLNTSVKINGTYTLVLKTGIDGNTLINECGKETPAGSFIFFKAKDTVSAKFNTISKLGCKFDTILFSHNGLNGVNFWKWNFENSITSFKKDTAITYTVFGDKTATLIVSNGFCNDTATATVNLPNTLKANFENTAIVCPNDGATFKDKSIGNITEWQWNFGNGFTSNSKIPSQQFYTSNNTNRDVITALIVKNNLGCFDTAYNTIKIVGNCYIAVPKAFTPNGDGLNDYLYPTNAYKATQLIFMVYNRLGQKVFETTDWTKKWNGTLNGNPQDPSTYVWILQYTLLETGERFNLKGSTVLLR